LLVCLFGLPPRVSTSPLALLTQSLDLCNCLINPAYGFYTGFRLTSNTEYFAHNESSRGFSAPSSFRLSERVVEQLPHYIQSLPSPSTSTVRLALPDKFDGLAGQCRGFIRHVRIYVESQRDQFSSEGSKCTFLMSLLYGKAIDWASAVWETDSQFRSSFEYLLHQLSEVFEYPEGGKDISIQLLHMSQGIRTAADFAIEFRTLAAQSGWNDVSLKAVFKQSLHLELQAELACKGEDLTFSEYTPKRKSTRQPFFNSLTTPSDHQEPMQINYAHLSDEERIRRRQQNLCYYCGETGHHNVECPHKARRSVFATSWVSVDQFSLPISK